MEFDMTPFTERSAGAVVEFRNEAEYEVFSEFFNSRIQHYLDMYPYSASPRHGDGLLCVRFERHRSDERFSWFWGPTRRMYEKEGDTVLTIDDIQLVRRDFGEISSDVICIDDLFLT